MVFLIPICVAQKTTTRKIKIKIKKKQDDKIERKDTMKPCQTTENQKMRSEPKLEEEANSEEKPEKEKEPKEGNAARTFKKSSRNLKKIYRTDIKAMKICLGM